MPIALEPAPIAAPRWSPIVARPLVLLCGAIVVAIGVFLAFGSIRIGAGNWIGLRMPVRRIWAHFTRFLNDEGASAAMVFGVTAAALVTLLGAAVVLWLAFALKDDPGDSAVEDTAGQ